MTDWVLDIHESGKGYILVMTRNISCVCGSKRWTIRKGDGDGDIMCVECNRPESPTFREYLAAFARQLRVTRILYVGHGFTLGEAWRTGRRSKWRK